MAARKRWRGTTKERGLGGTWQRKRKTALALLRDGDPCWRCGHPMYKWQCLDLDHVTPRSQGGADGPAVLAHASCNRRAGQRLTTQILRARAGITQAEGWAQARRW